MRYIGFASLGLAVVLSGCPEEKKDELPPAGLAGGSDPAAGPGAKPGEPGANQRKSKIAGLPMTEAIVTVDGLEMTRADLERVVAHRASQLGAAPNNIPAIVRDELESMAYDALVRRALLAQEAKRRGLTATKDEIEKQKQKLVAAVPEGRTLQDVLKMMHSDEAGLARDIEMDLSIAKLQAERRKSAPKLSEEEARKIYDTQPGRFVKNETASVSQILVAVPSAAPPDVVEAARKKADEIRAEVEGKDAATFAKVAREKSDDPKAKENGGDQGFFERRGRVPEFGAVAFGLKDGEVSRPFRTSKGFYVLRGQGVKKGEKMSWDEAKARIVAIETIARRSASDKKFIEELTTKATIVRHHEPLPPTQLAQPAMPAGMPGMPAGGPPGMPPPGMPGGHGGQGGDHMKVPLPSADNVLPGAPNPHAAGGGGGGAASKPHGG
jgi:parvulin-like peptidyl-prolyl isomerase